MATGRFLTFFSTSSLQFPADRFGAPIIVVPTLTEAWQSRARDKSFRGHSPGAFDPTVTERVIPIMLAEKY